MTRPRDEIPMTPNAVVIQLARLARELDDTVRALADADRDATDKGAAWRLAYSMAFMAADGPMEIRKHKAVAKTHEEYVAAEVAAEVVRHMRGRIDAIKVRIEVGRSYGAAVRAELNLAQAGVD